MLRFFSQFMLWLLLLMLVWLGGLGWFIKEIPEKNTQPLPAAEAIVVLTGGKGRLETALILLAEGKGSMLFISGAGKEVAIRDVIERSSPATQIALRKRFSGKLPIVIGSDAENTIGNAGETKKWLAATGYKSLLLVTSNYHMPRSLVEFRAAMPGISFIAAPVFPEDFSTDDIHDDDNRALLMSEYHKFIASLLRHAFLSFTRAP